MTSNPTRHKRFLRFRRDAEGRLTFHGIQTLAASTSAPDILVWRDRGVEAIWQAAWEMVDEAKAWKGALDESPL